MGKEASGIGLVALFTTAGFLEAALWGQLNAFLPLYLPALGVPASEVAARTGLSTMIGTLVALPTLPFWGALADRYARKPVIVRSFVVYAVGCAVAALAKDFWLFVVAHTIMNLSMGNSGLMMATLSERVTPRRSGLAIAMFSSAPPLGAFLGPVVSGPFVDAHGVRSLLGLEAAIMAMVIAALSFGYRDTFVATERRKVSTLAAESLVLVARSARLRRLFPALFFLFGGWLLANLYVALLVAARFPDPQLATRVGWVLACGGVGTILLAPSLGALGDRVGVWKTLLVVAAVEALCWPLPGLAPNFGCFLAAWGLANGLAAGVFGLAFSALAGSAPPGARGRVMAFAYLPSTGGYGVAAAVGSLAPGAAVSALFPVASGLTALGFLGLLWAQQAAVSEPPDPPRA